MQGDIREFLNQDDWAVVGVSIDPEKYGNKVYFKLKNAGYNVFAINPNIDQINGDPCYSSLSALPLVPDAVSIVVPPNVTEIVIEECAKLGIQRVWMQPGSENIKAVQKCHDNDMNLIHNQCVLIQARVKIK